MNATTPLTIATIATPAGQADPAAPFAVIAEATVIPTITLTNVCECAYCPTCSIGFTGGADEPCDDCGETIVPTESCYGDCDDNDYLNEQFAAWEKANHSDFGYLVTGAGMGWRQMRGSTTLTYGELPDNISALISVKSEWTQRWTIDPREGGVCTAIQSHHDAQGETYAIQPLMGCEGDRGYLDY